LRPASVQRRRPVGTSGFAHDQTEGAMNGSAFDRRVRRVTTDASRRNLLAAAGRSALGAFGLASLRGADFAEAKRGGKKRKRKRKKKRKEHQNGCQAPRLCGVTCCPEGDRCVDPATGTCVTGSGTCASGADSCAGEDTVACNPDSPIECICVQTMEGATACVDPFHFAYCSDCTTDAECRLPGEPAGMRCVDHSEGCYCEDLEQFNRLCMPPCPKPT
jgi:hypothetical protein